MTNKKKVAVYLVGVSCVAFILGGWLGVRYKERHFISGAGNETLFFADGGSTLSALLYVAYEKTFFFTQKVNFHLSYYQSGRQALNALIEGRADLATVADVPIVHSILDGDDFFVLATIANSRTSVGILALEEIRTPEDLRGRKIGYSPGTNSEYFLNEFLIKYGISKSDVVLVPVEPDKIEEALGTNKVQAVSVFDPGLTSLKDILGNKVQVFYAPDIYTFYCNVVASRRMLNYPSVLENIVRALHVAEQFSIENPKEAIHITSRYLRMNENQTKNIWSSLSLEVNLMQSLLINLEREAQWTADKEDASTIPDFGKYIYSDAMRSILPNRITIIE